jgi:hypothetical protein
LKTPRLRYLKNHFMTLEPLSDGLLRFVFQEHKTSINFLSVIERSAVTNYLMWAYLIIHINRSGTPSLRFSFMSWQTGFLCETNEKSAIRRVTPSSRVATEIVSIIRFERSTPFDAYARRRRKSLKSIVFLHGYPTQASWRHDGCC